MKRSEINAAFRRYVKSHLSPTQGERDLISSVYGAVQSVLGINNCLQIGSYPRFTSITPVHDLDVLYIAGRKDVDVPNPSTVLQNLENRLNSEFVNPTRYETRISRQTHSITISFLEDGEEFFSVDVVPAYVIGQNEFREDKYIVPEIISKTTPTGRRQLYNDIARAGRTMTWIKSDPRGYITVASRTDAANSDFRKAVKFIKAWRCACKQADDNFKLKSFHLERALTNYFMQHPNAEIFEGVFSFFCDLPTLLQKPTLPDRADTSQYIDAYVAELTEAEKMHIIESRDNFLIKLEALRSEDEIPALLEAGRHRRSSLDEEYLFDSRIPVFVDEEAKLRIQANVLPRDGGFTAKILDAVGFIEIDRQIQFRLARECEADHFRWKVKNANASEEPRGEITIGQTRRDPESTKYNGKHFVECYAILDGVCIAVARQNVELKRFFG